MMSSTILKNYPLLHECLEALNESLLAKEESKILSKLFDELIPVTDWGKVDWDKINNKIFVGYDPRLVVPSLEKLLQKPVDKNVYIEWSTLGIPVIKTNLDAIADHFDDVACVAHEKFIFNPTQGYIVEIRVGGEITVGLLTKSLVA